jgi:hypothetical protein
LWMPKWTFEYHKMWGISWLAEELLALQEEPCFMELVLYLPLGATECAHRVLHGVRKECKIWGCHGGVA